MSKGKHRFISMKSSWPGFSIIELLIIITIVSSLVIVTAPSIAGIFKRHYLSLNAQQLVQDIRDVQTSAFIEHNYHKIKFDASNQSYSTFVYNTNDWDPVLTRTLHKQTIQYDELLDDTLSLIYGPNGKAYLCNQSAQLSLCLQNQLSGTARLLLLSNSKSISIEFLPFNGFVSSNYSIN